MRKHLYVVDPEKDLCGYSEVQDGVLNFCYLPREYSEHLFNIQKLFDDAAQLIAADEMLGCNLCGSQFPARERHSCGSMHMKSCGTCWSVVMAEDWDLHVKWHEGLGQ